MKPRSHLLASLAPPGMETRENRGKSKLYEDKKRPGDTISSQKTVDAPHACW